MISKDPYTISTSNDDRNKKGKQMISFSHDNREPEAVQQANDFDRMEGRPPHIKKEKEAENVYIIKSQNEEDAYQKIFGESIEKFNAGQKRKDRKTSVQKEMEKIQKDKRNLCYEMIVQVGNKDYRPDDKTCKEILKKYVEEWLNRFPNMKIVNAVIHMDEDGAPHLHIIYIPVKTKEGQLKLQEEKYKKEHDGSLEGFKQTRWKGTDMQNSLSGALEEMGYDNSQTVTFENEKGEMVTRHDYKNGALTQWQADFNGLLEEICTKEEYGFNLDVHHPLAGEDICHQETNDFKHDQQIRKNLKEENASLKEENVSLKEENETLRSDIAEKEMEKAEAREEAEKAWAEVKEAKEEAEKLKEENASLKEENVSLKIEKETSQKEKEEAVREARSFKRQLDSFKIKNEEQKKVLEKDYQENADKYRKFLEYQNNEKEAEDKLACLQKDVANEEKKYSKLRNAIERSQEKIDYYFECMSNRGSAVQSLRKLKDEDFLWQMIVYIAEKAPRFVKGLSRLVEEYLKKCNLWKDFSKTQIELANKYDQFEQIGKEVSADLAPLSSGFDNLDLDDDLEL